MSRRAPRALPGDSLRSCSSARREGAALPLAGGTRPHRPRGTSRPPRLASAAAGSRPRTGCSRQPAASRPGSAQGRGSGRRPRPGVTKWRLLFVCRRRRFHPPCPAPGPRLPPPPRPPGSDPHRCSEGGRAKRARAKLSRLDPQRDPSSAFPHWTKWRPATPPPAFIYGQASPT